MEVFDMGAYIRLKRTEKKLTQAQLSKLTGLSASLISGIENGTTKPSVDSLVSLALALSADMNEMCGLKKPTHQTLSCEGLNERQMTALRILMDELREKNHS